MTQPPCPLHRMFADGAWQGRRNQSARSSSCSSQISDASSPSRSSQNTAGTGASMSELASTDDSNVAMTDVEENMPSAGQGMLGSVCSDNLSRPTSQDAHHVLGLRSLRQHVPEGRNFEGAAQRRTPPRVSLLAQTLDSQQRRTCEPTV